MMPMKSHLMVALIAITFAGCTTKPPQRENILSSANPTTEIEQTEAMMKDAYDRQVDVLSPKNFADAKKSLDYAKSKKQRGKSNEDILNQVSNARGWLKEANEKAELAHTSMKGILDARAGALKAGAAEVLPREWKKAENDLNDIATSLEKGNLKPAERKGPAVIDHYREIEKMTVKQVNLSAADENLKHAKKSGAERKVPKTYNLALMKFENAQKLINSDPRNSEAIRRASEDATRESFHLTEVLRKVNAGNTEDLVLLSERQQRQLSSLQSEFSSTEEELQMSQEQLDKAQREREKMSARQTQLEKTKELTETAENIRSQFKPNEAEVYTEGGKVMVRLKALQFPSNQATLSPKNRVLLNKVQAAIADVDAARIVVEGHTDSTGNDLTNKILAQKRAETVQNFLLSKGTVSEERLRAIGRGEEEPIGDNSTPQGRAQNRRIDLVIETE